MRSPQGDFGEVRFFRFATWGYPTTPFTLVYNYTIFNLISQIKSVKFCVFSRKIRVKFAIFHIFFIKKDRKYHKIRVFSGQILVLERGLFHIKTPR